MTAVSADMYIADASFRIFRVYFMFGGFLLFNFATLYYSSDRKLGAMGQIRLEQDVNAKPLPHAKCDLMSLTFTCYSDINKDFCSLLRKL